jgi:hypothetical protein
VQDGLNDSVRRHSVRSVKIRIDADDTAISLHYSHHGDVLDGRPNRLDAYTLGSISHRVRGLGGELTVSGLSDAEEAYTVSIPRSHVSADTEESVSL